MSALFVPLKLLQKSMGVDGRVNTILLDGAPARPVAEAATLEDMGLRVRPLPAQDGFSIDSTSAVLSDDVVQAGREAAASLSLDRTEVLIYLANEMRTGERAVPYSLVAALDNDALGRLAGVG